jgi:hypothetical protein
VTDAVKRLALPRLTIDVDGTVVRTGATVGWAFRGFNRSWTPSPTIPPRPISSAIATQSTATPSANA